MVLTDRQRHELHLAMLDYLNSRGADFAPAASAFQQCAQIEPSKEDMKHGLLERKWTMLLRLQSRVLELESQIEQLQLDLKAASAGKRVTVRSEFLPRSPALRAIRGHREAITQVALHPTFSLAFTASEDASIRVWDIETGQQDSVLRGHTNSVLGLSIRKDGRYLASCSSDCTIKLWSLSDTSSISCFATLKGHDHTVSAVSFIGDTQQLLSASRDKSVRCWDIDSGLEVAALGSHTEWVTDVTVSDNGEYAASCSLDKSITVWNVRRRQRLSDLRGHSHAVTCVRFLDGTGADTLTRHRSAAAAKASVGKGSDREDVDMDGERKSSEESNDAGIERFVYLASASRDKSVRLWNVSLNQCLLVLSDHDDWVRAIAWHPCGRYLVSVAEDRCLRVWDAVEGVAVRVIEDAADHFMTSVAVSATAPLMVTAGVDAALRVWGCQ